MDKTQYITSADDLERMVLKLGFLPFFINAVDGFSVEEHTPDDLWFKRDIEGPWEWKGPVIRIWQCAYGKFFRGKAGFVSLEWLPHLMNYRRAHYDLSQTTPDADGVQRERLLYDTIVEHESLLSRDLKRLCPFTPSKTTHSEHMAGQRPRSRGVSHETALGRLMMATLVVIADFEYRLDKHDRPYGWGVARYSTPEAMYDEELEAPLRSLPTPEQSFQAMTEHLASILPHATTEQIHQLLEIK